MSHMTDAIGVLALEVQELKEAIEQLTDRISEVAGLWQPRPDAAPAQADKFNLPAPHSQQTGNAQTEQQRVDNPEGGQLCLKISS